MQKVSNLHKKHELHVWHRAKSRVSIYGTLGMYFSLTILQCAGCRLFPTSFAGEKDTETLTTLCYLVNESVMDWISFSPSILSTKKVFVVGGFLLLKQQ